VRDASFMLRRGETLGVVGLVGSGRTELARAIVGAAARTAGRMRLDGVPFAPRSPREAIAAGIGLLPEDRKGQGLILHDAVRRNVSLASLDALARGGVIDGRAERGAAREWVNALRVRTPGVEQPVRLLSGGNQQKVVLARWMLARSRVLIFDEPTRGVDVGAKAEIYALMRQLGARGVGILMISSELPEALGMADRLLVMREGRITATLEASDATPERVVELMMPPSRSAA
jgi:ribose transport system ATP-binding protein